MKTFEHSEFEHERRAFAELKPLLPPSEHHELYPSIHITMLSLYLKALRR